jgi:hypothetical protein
MYLKAPFTYGLSGDTWFVCSGGGVSVLYPRGAS